MSIRRTKIVATIGPACESPTVLRALLREGVDVFRINTSHSTPEKFRYWLNLIRKASGKTRRPIAVLADLQGPRLRTGALKEHKPILIKKGQTLSIIPSQEPGFSNGSVVITTSCRELPRMVKKGDPILIDNGLIDLCVTRVDFKKVQCQVISGGLLGENKGINLPQAPMTLPALTAKDRAILKIAAQNNVDYVALSFVRTAADVLSVKKALASYGKAIPIIAKIEKPRAIEEIDSIIEVSDGLMIARGDLGIEMGVSKVPVIQKQLIAKANEKKIGVITATQMLESMMEHSRPSRAEASDIANAVFDGTDAVMLSGETAIGKHPVESVRMMSEIILEAEKHHGIDETLQIKRCQRKDHPVCAITRAAQNAASDLDAKAIVAFTATGKTAILLSKIERRLPIIALTPHIEISRRLVLYRGVIPMEMNYRPSTDGMLRAGEQTVMRSRLVKKGDAVVIVAGRCALPGTEGYMVKIHWFK